jgi:hypothetical protein
MAFNKKLNKVYRLKEQGEFNRHICKEKLIWMTSWCYKSYNMISIPRTIIKVKCNALRNRVFSTKTMSPYLTSSLTKKCPLRLSTNKRKLKDLLDWMNYPKSRLSQTLVMFISKLIKRLTERKSGLTKQRKKKLTIRTPKLKAWIPHRTKGSIHL